MCVLKKEYIFLNARNVKTLFAFTASKKSTFALSAVWSMITTSLS